MINNKKLRLIHIPQVGDEARFIVDVEDLEEAIRIANLLAYYDIMQFECNIKPDYSNATYLEIYNEESEKWDYYYDDNGRSFDEISCGIISCLEETDKNIWSVKRGV